MIEEETGSTTRRTAASWAKALAGVLILAAGIAAIVYWWRPMYVLVSEPERLKEWISRFGPLAPLVAIGLQALQVVVAPIPGEVINLADGYLFGVVLGTLYSMIGAGLGTIIAIGLARRFGRPWVVRIVPRAQLEKLDKAVQRAGPFALFLLFLAPFLPDTLCFLAGLTSISLPTLYLVTIVPRFPKVLAATLVGANAHQMTPLQWVIIGSLAVVVAVPLVLFRERIQDAAIRLAGRFSRKA
jgi:uncharacterized membrane protein YdjX (TVP38/TMEM64 family)